MNPETNKKPENITEQYFRETSEHYMLELKKKDRIIDFLKRRLKDVQHHLNTVKETKQQILLVNEYLTDLVEMHNDKTENLLREQSIKIRACEDNTQNLDEDIQDFIENFIEMGLDSDSADDTGSDSSDGLTNVSLN